MMNRRLLMGLFAAVFLAGCDVRVGVPTDTVVVGNSIDPTYFGHEILTGRDTYFDPAPVYTSGRGGRNPVIQSYTANPSNSVPQGQPITFQVVAYDPERDVLQYNWSATGGTLSTNSGQVVSWIPPTRPGVYTVMVTVANSRGGFVMGSLNLVVQDDGSAGVGGKAPKDGVIATPTPGPTPSAVPSSTPAPEGVRSPSPTPTPSAVPSSLSTPEALAKARGVVFGVVRDGDGALLAGAEVRLLAADGSFEGVITTGTDGKFRFGIAPAGTSLTLSAAKEGYVSKQRKISVVGETEASFDFEGDNAIKKK